MELEHYAIDAALSTLKLRVFGAPFAPTKSPTLMIREFAGWARFATGTFDNACLQIKVNAGSLVVEDIVEENRNAIQSIIARDVLEIEKYPEISFCSSNVSVSRAGDGQYWINLVGDLSLHGVNGSQPVAAQVVLLGNTLRAHGEFTLLQTSYKLKPVPVPGGMLKLKEEVKCSFEILARKQTDLAGLESRSRAAEGS